MHRASSNNCDHTVTEITWPTPPPAFRGWSPASGPEVDVPVLLELHDPYDPALRQDQRTARQLLSRDTEILHRVPAGAEGHPLLLQHFQRLFERGIDRALHEQLQRRAVHDELEGLDVLPAANAGDVIPDVADDELGLIEARLIELIDNPVLPGVLLEVCTI